MTLVVFTGLIGMLVAPGHLHPVLELTAGDMASLPAGACTTWHLTTPFKEFWVIA